eukprot:3776947-Prymnesium_polylepis.1
MPSRSCVHSMASARPSSSTRHLDRSASMGSRSSLARVAARAARGERRAAASPFTLPPPNFRLSSYL